MSSPVLAPAQRFDPFPLPAATGSREVDLRLATNVRADPLLTDKPQCQPRRDQFLKPVEATFDGGLRTLAAATTRMGFLMRRNPKNMEKLSKPPSPRRLFVGTIAGLKMGLAFLAS